MLHIGRHSQCLFKGVTVRSSVVWPICSVFSKYVTQRKLLAIRTNHGLLLRWVYLYIFRITRHSSGVIRQIINEIGCINHYPWNDPHIREKKRCMPQSLPISSCCFFYFYFLKKYFLSITFHRIFLLPSFVYWLCLHFLWATLPPVISIACSPKKKKKKWLYNFIFPRHNNCYDTVDDMWNN